MKQALWKRLLSYVFEQHIESTSSEHNPHLYVSLVKGRYQLCTANAIYSYEDLYDNFTEAFKQIDLDAFPVKRVLVLGFGLASVPLILEKRHAKDYEYIGIEIDEEVIYLASKYVIPSLSSPIQLIAADAFHYVPQCQESFDMVIVDLFLDDLIPERFEQEDFLEQLKQLIKPSGMLLYNRLAYNEGDIAKSQHFYDTSFKKVFPDAHYLDVRGNWMLLNRRDFLK